MVMAALDGIKNKEDWTPYGPYDVNVYKDDKGINSLPTSLIDAADALEADKDFLLQDGVFTDNIISNHISAIKKDFYEINRMPNPLEFIKYFNR